MASVASLDAYTAFAAGGGRPQGAAPTTVASLDAYMAFAAETAYLAGRLTMGCFGADVHTEFKPDDTPVTAADRAAERFIRSRIEAEHPGHAIMGEETGATGRPGASHRWYIDPIDGTKSFARGVPLFGVLIGLEIDGRPEVGAAYFPATDELLAAATGAGCWWNGRRARVSEVDDLSRAYVSCTDPGGFAAYGRAEAWDRLARAAYHRAGWGDAYGYLLVATGRIEVMVDPVLNPWDCAPFPTILAEAGGYFGNWCGEVTIHGGEGLATTRRLLPQVLRALEDAA